MHRLHALLGAALLIGASACEPFVAAPVSEPADGEAMAGGPATLLDTEDVPTPAGVMVLAERSTGTFVVTLARDADLAYVHSIEGDQLTAVGSYPTGDGPVAAVVAQRGEYAVVANSLSNDLSVFLIDPAGDLTETTRVSSGGINPVDVGILFDAVIVVANRGATTGDGEGVTVFQVDRNANISQVGDIVPTGPPAQAGSTDPHVISVSRRGLVAVGNSNTNDVTLLEVSRAGEAVVLPPSSRPVGASPKAVALGDDRLYVGTRAPVFGQTQDKIKTYRINRDRTLELLEERDAGWFLTDLFVNHDHVVATTWGGTPSAPVNELRTYRINGDRDLPATGALTVVNTLALPGNPSFQQTGILLQRDRLFAAVTQFQNGKLHWVQSVF